MIEMVVPIPRPSPHSQHWWSCDLSRLKKEMNWLGSQSYRYRAITDHPSHDAHRQAWGSYSKAIKQAKEQHWRNFLEGVAGKELWTAHKYISRPTGDGGNSRIPTLKVNNGDGTSRDVSTNDEKGGVFSRLFFPPRPDHDHVPADADYPEGVHYSFRPTMEQLRRCVARLRPYKAPGEDGIPNAVIKESFDLIAEYLLRIFKATFTLGTYSNRWREWDTIVLRKPGKPCYDVPKAHRPIALMNTIGKLLSTVVAEDLVHMCEKHSLLPDNHFGGHPGCCMTDAMHLMVHRIKGAWWCNKVAAVIFLDVEGMFPNAVMTRLLHNMRMWRVPESYILFIEQLLTGHHTRLKFDRYTSDWMDVDNGIVQGDPLSMVLYLFYNVDLLTTLHKKELKIGYIDDVNFLVEGDDFDKAYARLSDMMSREGGGFDWSRDHNLRFELSKLTLVGFSRRCMLDAQRPGKMMPVPRPSLTLGDTTVMPDTSHKFLGVLLDQELRWREQAERVVARATKWALGARRLARPAMGISLRLMRQLYQAVALPCFTYAADVWFTPVTRDIVGGKARGSAGAVRRLASVQQISTIAVTGALRTSATDVLELHANLPPSNY